MVKKNMNTKARIAKVVAGIVVILAAAIIGGAVVINSSEEGFNADIQYAPEQLPAYITDDMGEVVETNQIDGEDIPTVEEVDGGLFEDQNTGVSTVEGDYEDLGWSETYNTSSPEAFKNDTIGKCIYANNRYGAQCVSLARVFWWSYVNRDVSTCGTGMAKGMMRCAGQNAGNEFEVHWGSAGIQAGDWIIWETGQYGHIGMALGPVRNGHVTLLGENQGGGYCAGGGSATNIINLNTNGVIGYYRPKAYIKPEPTPEPTPAPVPTPTPVVDKCQKRTVVKGDTMGKIMKECRGEIEWGEAMNEYARHFVSTKVAPGQTVFYGWTHGTGYGLYANDVIEYKAD